MKKNTANQKLFVYAFDAYGDPVTGEADNITAQISLDAGESTATDDTNPTELDDEDHPGVYYFDLTQAETNADQICVTPVCSTSGVMLDPVIIELADADNLLQSGTEI